MKRILLIESHVVHGYVGTKAATFPLQCLDWDVDCIHTVQYSNHTGYGAFSGTRTAPDTLEQLTRSVDEITSYDVILTGYAPNAEELRVIGEGVKKAKAFWALDPVMGDAGVMYVDEDVVPVYRSLLHDVSLLLPNHFEAELLLGREMKTMGDVRRGLEEFHSRSVERIVITTLDIREGFSGVGVIASWMGQVAIWDIGKLEGYFTGTGDMFAALCVDRVWDKVDFKGFVQGVSEALWVVREVLKKTNGNAVMGEMRMKDSELKVIESRDVYPVKEFIPVRQCVALADLE